MGARRVAPATIITGLSEIGGAKVGGGDKNGRAAGVAPLAVVIALNLETRAAAQPVVEQRGAQRSRVHAVALAV